MAIKSVAIAEGNKVVSAAVRKSAEMVWIDPRAIEVITKVSIAKVVIEAPVKASATKVAMAIAKLGKAMISQCGLGQD
jgi:hypothetical protein